MMRAGIVTSFVLVALGCEKPEGGGAAIQKDPAKSIASASKEEGAAAISAVPSSSSSALAKVEDETIAALGGRDAGAPPDDLAVVARNRARFNACYGKELKRDPASPGGKVVVEVVIDASGSVSSAKATSTTASKWLTECVVKSFERVAFGPSDAGVRTISVPVSFSN
jgi:hypothetical protein